MPRHARIDNIGLLQHVIFRGIERKIFFSVMKIGKILLLVWVNFWKRRGKFVSADGKYFCIKFE